MHKVLALIGMLTLSACSSIQEVKFVQLAIKNEKGEFAILNRADFDTKFSSVDAMSNCEAIRSMLHNRTRDTIPFGLTKCVEAVLRYDNWSGDETRTYENL